MPGPELLTDPVGFEVTADIRPRGGHMGLFHVRLRLEADTNDMTCVPHTV